MSWLRNIAVVAVAAAGAIAVLYFIAGTPQQPDPKPAPARDSSAADGDTALAAEAESRRLLMQTAYADLERDRLMLNQQLGALNTRLWDVRLPAVTAKTVQGDMMAAKKLLTNPPLLGAFTDAAAIADERERVQLARSRLKTLEAELFPAAGDVSPGEGAKEE